MGHSPTISSPSGTPITERTVGELVAERPGRSRVFQRNSIDFCCQGGRTLEEACTLMKVALELIVDQLEAELADPSAPGFNPAELTPHELAEFIVETHHEFLREELPRLHAMAKRVANVHGGHTPSLVKVFQIVVNVEAELTSHMAKEERMLFPAVAAMSRGETMPMPLDGPISCMMYEHDVVGNAIAHLRELTHDFQPPAEACNTYRALFAGLADLEEDLHRHIHLENSVLFPAAQAMMIS